MALLIHARGRTDEALYVWKNGQLYRLQDGRPDYHVRECDTIDKVREFLRYASMEIIEEVEV